TLVESAEESGEIEADEKELLHSVFEFTDRIAREVMTPRVDMDAAPVGGDPAYLIGLIERTGHSRIPVYEETDDQIIGIVHAKDLLLASVQAGASRPTAKIDLRALMHPALFVPENKNLHELLAEMRAARSQMAVIQDEFGGTAGIVTIEDIVEELVGEIQDEYDVEEPEIIEDAGAFVVGGKARMDDLGEALGSPLASEEFDTVGGYVLGLFGRQPKEGECVVADGYRFAVTATDGRRILRMRVEKAPESEIEAAE
ncbi:MAG: HlyC/CorC family transporter, partial [Fimbriimonas ginsengisoli]|nr:HlyC/CorC family transporter [Fimbriimonas ginsengisoli]